VDVEIEHDRKLFGPITGGAKKPKGPSTKS